MLGRMQVHLALVDVHMPRLNGLDVVRHLHNHANSPACVLMSARMDDVTRRAAMEMNAFDVLDKPIPLNRLTKTVCKALAQIYGWSDPT